MGVRKKLSEESFRPTYRLNGVQRGATIAECFDRYGRWEGGYRLGVLVRKTAHYVYVKWDNEDEIQHYDQGDARYKVDRGFWRITNPRIGDPLQGRQGIALQVLADTKQSQQKMSPEQLTKGNEECENEASANADTPPTEENEDMAREQSRAAQERAMAQAAAKTGQLQERETYTAKQVATRCGTDAKTMRKFFRSNASTVEAVGQGGRYEFAAADLPQIKREFDSWRKRAESRSTKPAPKSTPTQAVFVPTNGDHDIPLSRVADAIERSQEEDTFDFDGEPTDDDLDQIELDLDDFDAEEVE